MFQVFSLLCELLVEEVGIEGDPVFRSCSGFVPQLEHPQHRCAISEVELIHDFGDESGRRAEGAACHVVQMVVVGVEDVYEVFAELCLL